MHTETARQSVNLRVRLHMAMHGARRRGRYRGARAARTWSWSTSAAVRPTPWLVMCQRSSRTYRLSSPAAKAEALEHSSPVMVMVRRKGSMRPIALRKIQSSTRMAVCGAARSRSPIW